MIRAVLSLFTIITLASGWVFLCRIPMQITKELTKPSYPETDGLIVNATEVDGVLETEGTVAAAGITQDRYAAFRACMKGPGVTTDKQSHCWPSAVEDGYVYWVCRSLLPVCLFWDSDGDGDVDLRDYAGLQGARP